MYTCCTPSAGEGTGRVMGQVTRRPSEKIKTSERIKFSYYNLREPNRRRGHWCQTQRNQQRHKIILQIMSVILQNYHRLHEETVFSNHPIGKSQRHRHQVLFRNRQIPRPSAQLIRSLWALCIALLFIVIIILIITVTGQTEQIIQVALRNLSLGVHSRVEGLSQDDFRTLEKLTAIEASMMDLKGKRLDEIKQNMEVELRNFSMEMHSRADQLSQDDSMMMEKLSTVETSMKTLAGKRLDEIKQNMEVELRKLSMEMHSRADQLSQDDSVMMEKLSTVETSMKTLAGQRLDAIEKNMDTKLRNLSMGMHTIVRMRSEDDSKVVEKLSALETSMKDLTGPLSKNLEMVVGAVGRHTEEIQTMKGSLTSEIQKIVGVVGKQTKESQKGTSSVLSRVTEVEASVKRILSNDVIGSLSRDIQKVSGSVEKLAEEIRKGKSSGELCAKGWMNFGGSCYFWSSSERSWNDAKKDCVDKKSHLVVVTGSDEMMFLRAFSQKKIWWIGLSKTGSAWNWVDGTSYKDTPKFWEAGQPDNFRSRLGGEECAQLRNADGWNDAHCSVKHQYICKQKIS